ncbi:MAG TPA: hypothetical protein PLW10_00080 [Myxococcota bacterium]|nr:hypothetical protein [Myxococcales bacterium]HPG24003.1 hypothetical protein [Myxococcota bacterium]
MLLVAGLALASLAIAAMPPAASAEAPGSLPGATAGWKLASTHVEAGLPLALYVEAEPRPGNPTFRIDTRFAVSPAVAASTLMAQMVREDDVPSGQRRRVLARGERENLIHTFIDLPFLLADREIALRIRHTDDPATGIHRVDFADDNALLPPPAKGVLRLENTGGYWEFRPAGSTETEATYVTRTDIGGSIPASIGDRLMRGQAFDSVERLRKALDERQRTHVAGAPPAVEGR